MQEPSTHAVRLVTERSGAASPQRPFVRRAAFSGSESRQSGPCRLSLHLLDRRCACEGSRREGPKAVNRGYTQEGSFRAGRRERSGGFGGRMTPSSDMRIPLSSCADHPRTGSLQPSRAFRTGHSGTSVPLHCATVSLNAFAIRCRSVILSCTSFRWAEAIPSTSAQV